MRVVMIGINHRTAGVELRESLALDAGKAQRLVADMRTSHPGTECVLISTCNRLELYIARPAQAGPGVDDLRQYLARHTQTDPALIASATIHREQEACISHLFRVCSGLDSMVLGEPQVLGQVRRAYEAAIDEDSVGPVLHRVFQGALTAAKQTRNKTQIDAGRTSVSSIAVAFARNIFDSFSDKSVLVIGAGEMIKGAVHALKRVEPGKLWIVNRSLDNANDLAQSLRLTGPHHGARPWQDLAELLVKADIVVSCTGATEPVIELDRFRPLVKRRRNRPMFMIDMAVPRDIDPAIGSLNNIYLYNLDDLQQAVEATHSDRQAVVGECESILHSHVARCMGDIRHRDISKLVKQLRRQLASHAQAEQQRTIQRLTAQGGTPDAEKLQQALDEHNHRLLNKILHQPLKTLKPNDPDAPLGFYAAALRRLFSLDDDAVNEQASETIRTADDVAARPIESQPPEQEAHQAVPSQKLPAQSDSP